MATFNDIFGGNDYVSIKEEDGQFVGVLTEIPRKVNDRERGKQKYMVRESGGGKWKPMLEGEFDESDVDDFFEMKKMQFKLQDEEGKEWTWDLSRTAEDAFVAAWKAAGNLEIGDTVAGKLIDTSKKPYTWKFKIVPQD